MNEELLKELQQISKWYSTCAPMSRQDAQELKTIAKLSEAILILNEELNLLKEKYASILPHQS